MKPAFKKDGLGTAGNASIISDGAAAVVVMSRDKAEELGCTVMASHWCPGILWYRHEICSRGAHMGHTQMSGQRRVSGIEDVDLFEINEAFSAAPLWRS
jgi:acetyl-CoA C-acetyltransferase